MCDEEHRLLLERQLFYSSNVSIFDRLSAYFEASAFPVCEHEPPIKLILIDWRRLSWYYSTAIVRYRSIESVLQKGNAQCGFVATAMAASAVGRRPNVHEMFVWAFERGMTNIGDIFDIFNMKALCDRFVGVPSTVLEFPSTETMVEDLLQGRIYLVPYDAGFEDGAPSKFNGHKAHWAVIFGVLLMRPPCCTRTMVRLCDARPIFRGDLEYYAGHRDSGLDLVLAQHGWYSEPDIWTINDLRESCWQLNEVDPKGAPDYILPLGGIREGLRGKVLRLEM